MAKNDPPHVQNIYLSCSNLAHHQTLRLEKNKTVWRFLFKLPNFPRFTQGATLLLGLACGGVTDARTLLQRVLGMRMYGPERLSLRVMANLAAACAASTEASQPGAAHGSRASGSSSSNSSEGAYVKDSTTPRSGSTCSTGSTEPETGLHLSNQSSTRAPSAANQEGLRSPSFYYQHALEAAVAAVKVCGDGGREFDKGQKTGVRRRLSRKSNRMGVR
eukprot:1141220-Pelagomonas_calceolata.AAC.5